MDEHLDPPFPKEPWVFVCHCHKDMREVRKVRDELERNGREPLLFYLKCMEDDSRELPELIRREIKARRVFLLCDSVNARSSQWVRDELEIVKPLADEGHVIFEVVQVDSGVDSVVEAVDVASEADSIVEAVRRICRRTTVFISNSHHDAEISRQIADRLRQEEFEVFLDVDQLVPGAVWKEQILSALDDAASRGFVIVLLSQAAMQSQWQHAEIEYAITKSAASRSSAVIPVIVADAPAVYASLPLSIRHLLAATQLFDLTGRPVEDALTDLVNVLRSRQLE